MKTALITTTINVPSVLALYRRFDPSGSVRFFVATDLKTPPAAKQFCENLGNCEIVERTSYKCAPIIGDNSIQKRNLALLRALEWGADFILSLDDDNIPIDPNYFHQFQALLGAMPTRFNGLKVSSPLGWFDVGTLLEPPATHRGFPHDITSLNCFTHVIDAKIGVAAGMVLGDPDTSVVERIAKRPNVRGISEILKSGFVVDPTTWTVWNSQNTAIVRELAPAWSMVCGVSRYDDIFASLIAQRVMRDRGYHVHFGRPLVFQQRNQHDLLKDLAGETWGMNHVVKFAEWLDTLDFLGSSNTVIDATHCIFAEMRNLDWMPKIAAEAGLAFLEDCERVL